MRKFGIVLKYELKEYTESSDLDKANAKLLYQVTFTQDDYKALVASMFDGTVKVSNDITAEPAVTTISVEYLGNLK